ncbi:hypothetical protein BDY19DRAFT_992098 [Irpex rosettiformis]|uniref:Uncharacterized protein n=1 Tax=Irpex rosettiformis TaxID=378272 RepID=A0ACB8U9N9_9APHY|nr:hypothetical protein BDY19DRAFT_992098 [Irpex rosettiformis]
MSSPQGAPLSLPSFLTCRSSENPVGNLEFMFMCTYPQATRYSALLSTKVATIMPNKLTRLVATREAQTLLRQPESARQAEGVDGPRIRLNLRFLTRFSTSMSLKASYSSQDDLIDHVWRSPSSPPPSDSISRFSLNLLVVAYDRLEMEAPCLPVTLPLLDDTLGAAFVGNIAAAVLYGVTNLQIYTYFERNNDGLLLRIMILILWALDTLHLILISHTLYFYTVTHFGSIFIAAKVTWSIMTHVSVTGVSDFLVRLIFASRVYRFSGHKKWLLVTIIVPTFVVFGFSIAFTVRGWQIGTYDGLFEISWILYTAFGAGVFVDGTIAISLCILLAQRRTGIRRTDSMVRSLMLYSINTGALTRLNSNVTQHLCARCFDNGKITQQLQRHVVKLIRPYGGFPAQYATMPANFVFIAFYFVLPKLFLNSLLATLNARQKLRSNGTDSSGVISIPLTSIEFSTRPMLPRQSTRQTGTSLLEIEIQKTVDKRTDSMADLHSPESSWKAFNA